MRRVLLIKLTSLGDLIHALPALSDAKSARPELEFDWVIDENFQEIAAWHPAVKGVITTNHRKWREALAHPRRSGAGRETRNRNCRKARLTWANGKKAAPTSWM